MSDLCRPLSRFSFSLTQLNVSIRALKIHPKVRYDVLKMFSLF